MRESALERIDFAVQVNKLGKFLSERVGLCEKCDIVTHEIAESSDNVECGVRLKEELAQFHGLRAPECTHDLHMSRMSKVEYMGERAARWFSSSKLLGFGLRGRD